MLNKNFLRLFILAVLVMDLVLLAGCTASWITEAQSIVSVLVGATANILAIIAMLSGKTVSPAAASVVQEVFGKITAGLTLIGKMIDSYTTENSTSVLADITAAIDDVKANLASILGLLNVTDEATIAKFTELIGLVETEVESLASLLPVFKGGADIKALKAALAKSKLLNAKDFEKAFKSLLEKPTGSVVVDEAVAVAVK